MLVRSGSIVLALGLAVGALSGASPGGAGEERGEDASGPIVVRNYYWARAGMADEVYRQRLHASAVRRRLGLEAGRVLRRRTGSAGQPDVIWECEYPSLAAREADVRALAESGEFDEVMRKMGTLIERFERAAWSVAPAEEDSP